MFRNVVFLLMLSLGLGSCATPQKSGDKAPAGTGKGTSVIVEDARELDGCTFLLVTAAGQKLQPVNLEERYHQNGITLVVTYKKIDGMSVCMSGTMVELLTVEKSR